MSLLERPHQDYYFDGIDFKELAQSHDEFGALYRQREGLIDWQDPQTLQALTRALLKRDFQLTLITPQDRLCPPVPVRFNYIRWIQQIIDTTGPDLSDTYDHTRRIVGFDIGVGATCIYALLACSSRPQWNMIGTDIDPYSLELAGKNIEANGLSHRITIRQNVPEAPLLPLECLDTQKIDFVMCNPPFYSSKEDMSRAYQGKVLSPHAVCTGSANEMICEGGDIGFATRILGESLQHKDRIQWYTCMLGRLESAKHLVTQLKQHSITNFAVTNLRAGQKTTRWAVAWSFGDHRPRIDVVRHGSLAIEVLAPATQRTISVPGVLPDELGQQVDQIMSALDLKWSYRPALRTGTAMASGDVWSRSARRRKKALSQTLGALAVTSVSKQDDSSVEIEDDVALAVRLQCEDGHIQLRWLRGDDAVLLDSYIGMLRRALGMRRNL